MSLSINIGRIDILIAAVWLVISRLGLRPMNIQEPIVLLTAVHFHYAGFATALLAGTLAAYVRSTGRALKTLNFVVVLILVLPFLVATGFIYSPTFKLVAVFALSLNQLVFAGLQFWLVGNLRDGTAHIFLRLSSAAVIGGMILAITYAVGDWLGQNWLPIPLVASTHGLLNGLGFVLMGLLGWLLVAPLESKIPL